MPKGIYIRTLPWATLGRPRSEETKRKISITQTGKKHTKASKKKMSIAKKLHPTRYWLNKKRPLSIETREKISNSLQGEKAPNWKGGITPINAKIRSSLEYKLWRNVVFERDNYTCILCGNNKSGNLNADHIKRWADFPELRYEVSNGRTLCINCHKKTETYGNKNQCLK